MKYKIPIIGTISLILIFIVMLGAYLFRSSTLNEPNIGRKKYCYAWGKISKIELYSKDGRRLLGISHAPRIACREYGWEIISADEIDSNGDGKFDTREEWHYDIALATVYIDEKNDGSFSKTIHGNEAMKYIDNINKKISALR